MAPWKIAGECEQRSSLEELFRNSGSARKAAQTGVIPADKYRPVRRQDPTERRSAEPSIVDYSLGNIAANNADTFHAAALTGLNIAPTFRSSNLIATYAFSL